MDSRDGKAYRFITPAGRKPLANSKGLPIFEYLCFALGQDRLFILIV